MPGLRSSQGKPVIRRLPQTQSNKLLTEAIINLWPKRADNIFTRRRNIPKIIGLNVEMAIPPRRKRFFNRFSEFDKLVKCSTASVVFAAKRCLSQITMPVTKRIVALAVELRIFGIGKSNRLQTMGSIERHPHSEENAAVIPNFREKIFALMQTDAMQRHRGIHAFVKIPGQTFRSNRTILKAGDILIEISVIKFVTQRTLTTLDCVVAN
jgi:hypothetical protein